MVLRTARSEAKKDERLTIFREPRLPSGFPDLVVVVWNESVAFNWAMERGKIISSDLRLMQYLATTGPAGTLDLKSLFGSETERSLRRLEGAEMVVLQKDAWRARALSRTFAIRRIVAIEAKIAEWRAALDQAFINTWFTPESYVLLPQIPPKSSLLETALQRGIGVLSKEKPGLVERRERQPRSYASWLREEKVSGDTLRNVLAAGLFFPPKASFGSGYRCWKLWKEQNALRSCTRT